MSDLALDGPSGSTSIATEGSWEGGAGDIAAATANAEAHYETHLQRDQFEASGEATAKAEVSGRSARTLGPVSGELHGRAGAKALANGNIQLGWDGLRLKGHANAFAGAQAGVHGESTFGPFTVYGDLHGQLGAGVEASGELAATSKKVGGSFGVGLSLGAGVKVGGGVHVNPEELLREIYVAKAWLLGQ